MEDTLVAPILGTEPTELSELVQCLRRDVVDLRKEVADLRRENNILRQEAGFRRSVHAEAVRRAEQLEAVNEQLRGEVRNLQGQLFGRKSEKRRGHGRSNRIDGESEGRDPSAPRRRGQQANRPGPPRRDYSHLPVVEDTPRELPHDQRVCPQCGAPLSPNGCEESEQIEIEVRPYRRRIPRRRYQRTCTCSDCPRTFTAPPAPKLIPKGLLAVSVWVEILLDKFLSHRPTERLLSQWRLLGLDLAAGTIAGGLERIEPLFEPLYRALLARNAQSVLAQADETRWMVFIEHDGKTGHRWWLWVFLGADTVVFRLDPSRSHQVPEGHFPTEGRIVLVVDRYAAYKTMAQVKKGTIVLAFCWAHVRRDFVEVGRSSSDHKEWALAWLERIRELYHCDRQRRISKGASDEFCSADSALRQTVTAMRAQADAELADTKLPAPRRMVLESLQEHWEGLTRFVSDLRIPLDNNASERQVRGPALGRKNYYGSGALWSGRLAAMLFSLFATLDLAKINIRKWLTWFLETCAEEGAKVPADIDPFLPWSMSEAKRRELALDTGDTS